MANTLLDEKIAKGSAAVLKFAEGEIDKLKKREALSPKSEYDKVAAQYERETGLNSLWFSLTLNAGWNAWGDNAPAAALDELSMARDALIKRIELFTQTSA